MVISIAIVAPLNSTLQVRIHTVKCTLPQQCLWLAENRSPLIPCKSFSYISSALLKIGEWRMCEWRTTSILIARCSIVDSVSFSFRQMSMRSLSLGYFYINSSCHLERKITLSSLKQSERLYRRVIFRVSGNSLPKYHCLTCADYLELLLSITTINLKGFIAILHNIHIILNSAYH